MPCRLIGSNLTIGELSTRRRFLPPRFRLAAYRRTALSQPSLPRPLKQVLRHPRVSGYLRAKRIAPRRPRHHCEG